MVVALILQLAFAARELADSLVELGFETRDDPEKSLLKISTLLLEVAKRLRHQTFIDPEVVREAGRELPLLIRENPIVRVPGHVVLLGRVIALLSGLGHTLDVRIDMLRTILPYAMGQRPAKPDTGSRTDVEPRATVEKS